MIAVGSRVKLKAKNVIGTVLELRKGFVRVAADELDGWFPLDELEEELSLIEKYIRGELDDGLDFILAIDAYRLLTEYKFNPYVLASSTKITIFPHQIDEVTHILDRPRMMVADETGLGKTITAALVTSELKARGLANKLLFVVPKALVLKWKDELEQRFELQTNILDSSFVRLNPEPFGKAEFCYVTSMDYLKQDHVLKLVEEASFDMVVVDEAHKLALETDRLDMGRKLAPRTNHMLFLTATPHNGNDDDYLERMKLLDPYVHDVQSAAHILIRNLKEDVIDLEGKEVFPPRSSETVQIALTREELLLHRMVDDYIARRVDDARDRRELNAIRFLGNVLRKRASSSLRALKLTLLRRLEKLGQAIEVERAIKKMKEAQEEQDEELYEESEQSIIGLTASKHEDERKELNELLGFLDRIGDRDSKLGFLLDCIRKVKESDPKAKIVVFSEYRDTVDYLFEKLSQNYRVEKIDGLMNIDERRRALNNFRDPDGAEIMVCTDAAGEGIDMQFANIEINYDLPWNPNRLEQRMGRIHRIGQRRPVYYYHFVLSETIDGYILSKVLEKIEAIRKAMGEKVYDVMGRLLTEEDISDLYNELLRAPKETWEAKVKRIEGIIDEKRRILEKINSLLSGYRLDRSKLEDLNKVRLEAVDKGEVRRFLEVYLHHKGGKIEPVKPEDEVYQVILPPSLAYRLSPAPAVFQGSFSSEVAQERNYPYLALGNRYIMEMIKDVAKPSVSRFSHPLMNGVLFVYRIVVKDGKKHERDGKLVAFLYNDSRAIEVDPRCVWDLDPLFNSQPEPSSRTLLDSKDVVEEEVRSKLQELKERCDRRLSGIKNKTKDIIAAYFSKKIQECGEKIRMYEERVVDSPHYSKLISKERNEIDKLRNELQSKLRQLESELSTFGFYELVGIAVVSQKEGADARKIVEKAGVEAVLRYERERAQGDQEKIDRIKDVSDSFRGYDVESFDRVIEVKSFKETGPLELTSHEWETAERMKEHYWLYAVEDALSSPKISTMQNPVERFKGRVKKIPFIDYRYIIDDWKS